MRTFLYGLKGLVLILLPPNIEDKYFFTIQFTKICLSKQQLGSDKLGQQYLENLKNENIDTSCVKIEESIHTGVAQIAVSDTGNHSIKLIKT